MTRGWHRLTGKNHPYILPTTISTGEAAIISPEEKIKCFLSFLTEEADKECQKLLIVMEDYHLVQHDKEVNRLVQMLLRYLPAGMRLIITSRSALPLPLGDLRAKGKITEISGKEMVFTLEETLDMFCDLPVNRETLSNLWENMEGWAAGLALARYVLMQEGVKEAPLSRILGYTGEYLEQEFINTLSPDQQVFLEVTSLLEYPDVEACLALSEDEKTEEYLEEFLQNHLFVISDPEGIYRYHQILRDHLTTRLKKRTSQEECSNLHLRAGEIYYRRGWYYQAINHFYQAGHLEKVTESLLQIVPELMVDGDYTRLKKWLDLLYRKVINTSPRLACSQASQAHMEYLESNNDLAGRLIKECEKMAREMETARQELLSSGDKVEVQKEPLLKVFALGPLRGRELISSKEWKNVKVLGLFRYLITCLNLKVEKDVLLETFWPERDPSAANHNFSSCLYTLRRVLEPHLEKGNKSRLVRYEKGVMLDPERRNYAGCKSLCGGI